jgi:hypothetical protein
MAEKVITLLTDFGDFYPALMKGQIFKINPSVNIIDITHSVEPQNVYQGAFLLLNAYRFFRRAAHVAVVDPEVGSERLALAIKTKNYWFIGPDNGILYPSATSDGIKKIYVIDERIRKYSDDFSKTFHGRDLFAPAAALISRFGCRKIEDIAEPFEDFDRIKKLDLFECEIRDNNIKCRIVFIDRFGNAITNIRSEIIHSIGARTFYIGETEFPLMEKYSDVRSGETISLIGSFKTLEFSIREGNASETFNLRSGEITVGFE